VTCSASYPAPDGTHTLPNENGLGLQPGGWASSPRKQVIVALHGDAALSTMWAPSAGGQPNVASTLSGGYSAWQTVELGGYFVLAIDAGGSGNWGGPTCQSRISDAYTYAMSTLGSTSTKVGIMAWSMGGVGAMNWLAANPSKVSGVWLWEPALDLQFFNQTSVPYPGGLPYSASYAASAYNGGAGTASPTVGQAAEIATVYPSGFAGSDPMQNTSSFKGLGVPVKIVNASDDNAVPPGLLSYFVAQVNDPNVTLRSPQPLGSHDSPGPMGPGASTVPPLEVVQFFKGLAW
jgi:pimeloyl-ACP methyl ester carboxylesterase